MPNKTRAEIEEAVSLEMQLDPGLISPAERRRFINDALMDLGSMGLFEKEVVLPVTEDGHINMPVDYVDLITLRSNTGNALRPLETRVDVNATSNSPIGFIMGFDKIRLYPRPSVGTTVTLLYSYRPMPLERNEDRPDIPEGFDRMLVDFVVGHCHRKNGNIGLYREYVAAYVDTKELLRHILTRRINARVSMPHNRDYSAGHVRADTLLF